MLRKLQSLLAVGLTVIMSSQVFALSGNNIGNEVPSARSAGQGYVGTAGQNDDPAAVYSNPAAMTNLKGTQITLGAAWENLHGTYESDAGNKTKMRSVDIGVPNGAVTQSFMDGKMGVGLGVFAPYGLETHWSGDGALKYVATDSRIHMTFVTPAVAYKVTDMVSLGVGADYVNVFDASLEKKVSVAAINSSLSGGLDTSGGDANYRLKGTGANWGFHTGVMIQPNNQHAFGLVYHSKIKVTVNGTSEMKGLSGTSAAVFGGTNYEESAYTDIVLPQNIQIGYAYKPTEKWTYEANAAWYDWYAARDLNIRNSETNPNRLAVLNNGNPTPMSLRDEWSASAGVNYKATEKLQLRGGAWYVPCSMPESTFSPAYMDLTRYGLSIGSGYAITTAFSVDVAYNAIFFHNRHITNDTTTTYGTSGTYKDFANVLALNFTYRI